MSPKTSRIDVLIIGLGPAGAAAAAAARVGGLSVIAIDRRREVGVPVQCAEFIPLPLSAYAQSEGVIRQPVVGMKSYLPSGDVTANAFPGLMIDRAAFDQALAGQARLKGAELWLNSRMTTLDAQQQYVTVLRGVDTQSGASVGKPDVETNELWQIHYRVLVAADGPHSSVAHALGLPELDVVHTRQYTVPLLRTCEDTDIWLSNDFPGGYGWLFPKGEYANLGLGLDKRYTADLKRPLDALHEYLQDQGLVGAEIISRTGGAIPVGGLREHLHVGPAMFTGDAAGLTHPITGAGIPSAVISGERAGQAAVTFLKQGKEDAFADYEEDIRDQFEVSLERAVARRKWMAQQWNTTAAQEDAMHRKGWIAFQDYFVA
jgi:geranylgeranyl reductase family protein